MAATKAIRLHVSVFIRDEHRLYRSYFTDGRGVEMLGSPWSFLDLTPFGRQETLGRFAGRMPPDTAVPVVAATR